MKKVFVFLLLSATSSIISIYAQSLQPLPLGIDIREIPTDSRGQYVSIRTNERNDATRFLEKTVKENPNDLERISKFLQAGGSAFITYEMIDNKQYDLIDLMYKSNNRLIRFSQWLHRAASYRIDTTMIDFLINRGASLDLCGYYLYKGNDWGVPVAKVLLPWNKDNQYWYTPVDAALRWGGIESPALAHFEKKYNKYPTIPGWVRYVSNCIVKDSEEYNYIDYLLRALNNGLLANKVIKTTPKKHKKKSVDIETNNKEIIDVTAKVLNGYDLQLRHHNTGSYKYEFIPQLPQAIRKLGEYRKKGNKDKSEKFFQLIKIMIEKGVDVNCHDECPSALAQQMGQGMLGSFGLDSPMKAAMSYPNMLDVIKLLKQNGAKMVHFYVYKSQIESAPIQTASSTLEEYKELITLGEL